MDSIEQHVINAELSFSIVGFRFIREQSTSLEHLVEATLLLLK